MHAACGRHLEWLETWNAFAASFRHTRCYLTCVEQSAGPQCHTNSPDRCQTGMHLEHPSFQCHFNQNLEVRYYHSSHLPVTTDMCEKNTKRGGRCRNLLGCEARYFEVNDLFVHSLPHCQDKHTHCQWQLQDHSKPDTCETITLKAKAHDTCAPNSRDQLWSFDPEI